MDSSARFGSDNDSNQEPDDIERGEQFDLSRRVFGGILAAIFCAHLLMLALYFPPRDWASPEPFYSNSFSFHFARALQVSSAIRSHGRLWSYNPYLMAGYPAATRTEPVGNLAGIWIAVTPYLPPGMAYKILVIALLAAAPLAAAVAALWLGLDRSVCAIAGALGALGIYSVAGLTMIRAGMFAFLSASYLCLALGAFMYRWALRGSAVSLVILAVAGGLLTYLHPLTVVLLSGPAVGALLLLRRSTRRLIAMVAAFVMIAVMAIGWLGPIILTSGIAVHFSNWWHSPTTLSGSLGEMFSDRLIAPPLLVVALAIAGAISAPVKFAYKSALAGAILIFVLMAYFGSRVAALDNIEPGRFEAPFYFYAVPFAAMAIRRLWIRFGRLQLHRAARILLLTIAALFVLGTMRLVNLDLRFHGSIAATLPPRAAELDDWVAKSDPNARLIVEAGWSITDNQLKLPYFGADLGALWAATSGHQLIGASPSEGFTKFSFTTFDQDHAFGRPVQSWNPAELRKQLDIYNVGAAILWSDAAKQLFDSMPDAHVAAHVATNDGQFALYTIAGTRSFIAQGSAKAVRARPDCIQVTGAASGRMVLKYHYFRTLRVSPPIPIGPAATGNDDPIPFIELRNAANQDLKIYNGGFLGLDRPSCD